MKLSDLEVRAILEASLDPHLYAPSREMVRALCEEVLKLRATLKIEVPYSEGTDG